MRRPLLLAGLLLALPVSAQQGGQALDAPPPPPPVQSGEVLEPDITIIKGEAQTTYEYRINGELYMVKIVPDAGPPYFLIDVDGDGQLESRRSALDENLMVPHWMILRW
jgi:hypothetical protein